MKKPHSDSIEGLTSQRDNLLTLLRRLIRAVRVGNESYAKDVSERAERYMARECPPPQIIRAMGESDA